MKDLPAFISVLGITLSLCASKDRASWHRRIDGGVEVSVLRHPQPAYTLVVERDDGRTHSSHSTRALSIPACEVAWLESAPAEAAGLFARIWPLVERAELEATKAAEITSSPSPQPTI